MDQFLSKVNARVLAGVPDGFDAMILAGRARDAGRDATLHVARDEQRMMGLAELAAFFAPEIEIVTLPAWDCLPYDRVSPHPDVVARRIDALAQLTQPPASGQHRIVITTASAVLQRLPKPEAMAGGGTILKPGSNIGLETLTALLTVGGYNRADQVMEPGEYAVRGGLIDIYPPGVAEPVRIDLFGDEIEKIRSFDPVTQRTTGESEFVTLHPVSEIILAPDNVARFRSRYRELFGAVNEGDALYEAVSQGQRFLGMEHWLPLFHDGMATIFDYLPTASISLDHDIEEAVGTRLETVRDYYEARKSVDQSKTVTDAGMIYHPIPPDLLYLSGDEWIKQLGPRAVTVFRPYAAADIGGNEDAGGRTGREFADVRARPNENVYEAFANHVRAEHGKGRRVILACFSVGSRNRICGVLNEHGLTDIIEVDTWSEVEAAPAGQLIAITLGVERGFVTPSLTLVTEQDVLGDRLVRSARKRRKADAFIAEAGQLNEGDLVVHVEHGIGRYDGLETLTVGGAPHDCLR
ncbi:MAG: transcription-repair coupling factor, partial [Rhodobacteraceae bacterium]|nr:transcription-repair coupling factor [Paracoccaceae bacterium]